MKQKVFLCLVLLPLAFSQVFAQNISAVSPSGHLLYYTISGGNATVTFQNGTQPRYTDLSGDLMIPDTVEYNNARYAVTAIGDNAFHGCNGLVSVEIPITVTIIGSYAIYTDSALTVYLHHTTPPDMSSWAFNYTATQAPKFVVPCSAMSAYSMSNVYGMNENVLLTTTVAEPERGYVKKTFVSCDGTTIVEAVPNFGYHFDHWSSGSTVNPDTITISNDETITAYYGKNQYALHTYPIVVNELMKNPTWVIDGEISYLDNKNIWYWNGSYLYIRIKGTSTRGYNYSSTSTSDASTYFDLVEGRTYFLSFQWSCQYYYYSYTNNDREDDWFNVSLSKYDNTQSLWVLDYSSDHLNSFTNDWYDFNRTIYATGSKYKLKFHWHNDNYNGTNYPAAIRGLSFFYIDSTSGCTVTGNDTVDYFDPINLTAVPAYGYHFERWSDGNTSNPRQVLNDPNVEYTALFDRNYYHPVALVNDTIRGISSFSVDSAEFESPIIVTATPNYGYHFDHWSNGRTANPDTITILSDTTLIAYFAKNEYTLNIKPVRMDGNEFVELGQDTSVLQITYPDTLEYLDTATITITSYSPGVQFSYWRDGYTSNPRKHILTGDTTLFPVFNVGQCSVNLSSDTTQGTTTGSGSGLYLSQHVISATPAYGYHFDHWSDGDTNNPRAVVLAGDTSLTALFAKNRYAVTGLSHANDFNGGLEIGSLVFVNGNYTNRWIVEPFDELPTGIIISNNGSNWAYSNSTSYVWAYWPITIREAGIYGYRFSWYANGERYYDYLRAGIIPNSESLSSSWPYSAIPIDGGQQLCGSDSWHSIDSVMYLEQGEYKLAFYWRNNASTINNYPAAVKNISMYTAQQYVFDSSMMYVAGSDTVDYLDSVLLTAVALDTHFYFNHWSDGDTNNPRWVVAHSDTTLCAVFDAHHYDVALDVDTSIHGSVSGGGNYSYLSRHIIAATANYGYHFDHWSDGDTSNPRVITVRGDTTLTAFFGRNIYTVSTSCNNANRGYVIGGGTAMYGDTITLTAIPYVGYEFSYWNRTGTQGGSLSGNPKQVIVYEDENYEAVFVDRHYNVSLEPNYYERGSVSGGGSYTYGSHTINATPNYGYHFYKWSDSVSANPRVLFLESDTSLIAIFHPNEYTLALLCNDTALGNVIGSGVYFYQEAVEITAYPIDHYHFVGWSNGSLSNPDTITISGDMTITAIIAIDTYLVSAVPSDMMHGSVTGGGWYEYGTSCTVEATAFSGYHFDRWSNGVTFNPYTFVPTNDVELTAVFVDDVQVVNIVVSSANPAMGSVVGGGPFAVGETVMIEALPNNGYRFTHWQDNDTTNPRTFIATSDTVFTAYFSDTIPQYTITVLSTNDTMGRVYGGGAFSRGTAISFLAIANDRYRFVKWQDEDTCNPRTIIVTCDSVFSAYFAHITHTVTVESNDASMGHVSGGDTYQLGDTALLIAMANPGYIFDHWQDEDTDNPRYVLVTEDMDFIAYFVPMEGVADVSEIGMTILSRNGQIVITGAEGRLVTLSDALGRILYRCIATEPLNVDVYSSGVYLVQVDGCTAQRVVVLKQ